MMNMIMDDLRIYVKTDNQEILDKVKKYDRDKIEIHKKWGDFQDKYHVKLIGWDQHNGNVIVRGVIGDTSVLPGQWCKPDYSGFSKPFKKNKKAWGILSSMDLVAPDFGNIPDLTLETPLWGDLNAYFINTVYFEHDGYVYVSCGKSVELDRKIWSGIYKSEFDKAEEGKNSR